MTSPWSALWHAPAAVPAPPRRVWRDWLLVGVIAPLTLIEAALRPDVEARWLWAGVLLALVPTLLWRRTHPFTALATAFSAGTIVGLVAGGDSELFVTGYFLILLYALMRWGSGRAVIGGAALVVGGWALSFATQPQSAGDAIGGAAVVVATSALGFAFRWRAASRSREIEEVRLLEREQLARDLHDTVAHHVSAIAIQAQAGSAVAATDPAAAADVLRVIEDEAGRTLSEMRSMVGLLRRLGDDGDVALTPTPAWDDLARLADAGPPAVSVRVTTDGLEPAPTVAAAVFRIAQESVTNARRHAVRATRIDVTVVCDATSVRLEVRDDGAGAASHPPGFGVTGMTERAALLGGTCHAGPHADGGWSVVAQLPRAGAVA